MNLNKIVEVPSTTAGVAPTLTKVAVTFGEAIVAALTAPLTVLSSAGTTYYSESVMGLGEIATAAAGVYAGDRWGDRIPLLGGHRFK